MKIVVGLGNPGREYSLTRHNIGFMALDRFAEKHSLSFSQRKFKSHIATGIVAGEKVVLAKPQTFMNLSGDAVGSIVRFFDKDLSDLCVIYDDIDLPLGTVRLRAFGGSGGHKGMKSIIQNLGSEQIPRLRAGIRGDRAYNDLSEYVLQKFSSEERKGLDEILQRICEAVEAVLTGPFDEAMNRFN